MFLPLLDVLIQPRAQKLQGQLVHCGLDAAAQFRYRIPNHMPERRKPDRVVNP